MAEQKKVAVPISDKNKYIFLSVPNFKKSIEEVNSTVDKWLYLLNHAKEGNELPNFGSDIIQDAIERIKVENASDELMLADNEPIEKIVKYSHLPESKVLELQKTKQR